jgi:hypothetical protein
VDKICGHQPVLSAAMLPPIGSRRARGPRPSVRIGVQIAEIARWSNAQGLSLRG